MKKSPESYLIQSKIWAAVALAILIVAAIMEMGGLPNSGQQQFEYIYDLQEYTEALAAADPNIRIVLFLDSLFILCYAAAITFAAIGFADRNLPVAWFCGLGIVAIGILDFWENTTMVHSMDMLANGIPITAERMLYQVQVSATKWQASAAVLFAISFLLPDARLVEKVLVWGTRVGLAVAVPLFVINSFDARGLGGLLLLVSMASGFALLTAVTHLNSQKA